MKSGNGRVVPRRAIANVSNHFPITFQNATGFRIRFEYFQAAIFFGKEAVSFFERYVCSDVIGHGKDGWSDHDLGNVSEFCLLTVNIHEGMN